MTAFNSTPDDRDSLGQVTTSSYSISHGYSSIGHSWTQGRGDPCENCNFDGVSVSRFVVPDRVSDSGDGDVKRIARTIFTAEVADVIKVLRTCGALSTMADYFWCLTELWRILKPNPGDLA